MNIKALITMLVLGSSSVAMARPVAVSGHAGASVVVRDHRDYRAPAPMPAPRPTHEGTYNPSGPFVPLWVMLGSENRIVDGQMQFNVRRSMGNFSAVKLQSTSGKSLINRVEIQFANGRTQIVQLGKYLNAANPTIVIDLDGESARSIRKVTVVGRNARQSQFNVFAI